MTFNVTTWGWIHLIFGILLVLVGLALMRGSTFARVIGIALVSLNLIAQFSWTSLYPFWGLIAIIIDIVIIYALVVHGRELKASLTSPPLDTRPVTRVESFIPSLGWLRTYDRAWLSKDVVGGLAAGAVVIPQAMAYATIADLPVEVGLYTCMVPMVVYALLGGSRTVSVSTTSTVAVLSGSTLIAAGVAAEGTDPVGDLAMLTLLVGVILLVARVLRLGNIVDNISEATLIGVKSASGSPSRPPSSPSSWAYRGIRPRTTSSTTSGPWSTSSASGA